MNLVHFYTLLHTKKPRSLLRGRLFLKHQLLPFPFST